MKKRLRRLTAMLLAVSMVASMIGVLPAGAASTNSYDQIATLDGSTSNKNDTNNYAYYAQDGNYETTQGQISGAMSTSPPQSYDSPIVTAEDGAVEISKTIEGTSTENVFNIELMVKTTEELEKLEIGEDAAVILVMDVSGSMLKGINDDIEKTNNSTDTRIYAAKQSAISFIESFASNATSTSVRYASIVEFSGDETSELMSTSEAVSITDWSDVSVDNNYSKFVSAINSITIKTDSSVKNRETNIYAGLTEAYYMLDALEGIQSSIENVYVILLSDGSPDEPIADSTEMGVLQSTYSGSRDSLSYFEDAFGNKYYPNNYATSEATDLNRAIAANAATAVKKHDTSPTLYTVGFTTDSTQNTWLSGSIASNSGAAFTSTTASSLTATFDIIASEIKKAAEAWTVTDPMGSVYIELLSDEDDMSKSDADEKNVTTGSKNNVVELTDAGFIWNLLKSGYSTEQETVGNTTTTTYIYTLNYTVKLKAEAYGFQEDTYYLTNGKTYLEYYLTETKTSDTAYFLVPAVKGDIPSYKYDIEYYQWNKDTESYPEKAGSASKNISADLWSVISLPNNYQTKYENYEFATYVLCDADGNVVAGPEDTLQITGEGLVLKMYYVPTPTTVMVNHYQRIGSYDENGVLTWNDATANNSEYDGEVYSLVSSDAYGSIAGTTSALYVGDPYTLSNGAINSNYGDYVGADPSMKIKALAVATDEEGNANNVINLYYELIVGDPKSATVEVWETYEVWDYAFNKDTGKYDTYLSAISSTKNSTYTSTETMNYLGEHSVSLPAYDEELYERTSVKMGNDSLAIVNEAVTINASRDGVTYVIDVVYKVEQDTRGDEITVYVDHYYTRTETVVEDGVAMISEDLSFENELGDTVEYTGYAAETLNIYEQNNYEFEENETYTSDAGNASTIAAYPTFGDANMEDVDINLYYTLSLAPTGATVTVTHVFETMMPEVDEETGHVDWVLESTDFTDVITYPEGDVVWYVDQAFTAPLNPENREDYTFTGREGDNVITLTADDEDNLTLYYTKQGDRAPRTASVSIYYEYYVAIERVLNGVVTTVYEPISAADWQVIDTKWGVTGEAITFEAQPEYNGVEYTPFRDNVRNLTTTYGGVDITLKYFVAGESELVETSLDVEHWYYEKMMTVEEGVASYYEEPTLVNDEAVTTLILTDANGRPIREDAPLFVGMIVNVQEVTEYNNTEYRPLSDNPALTITLKEENDTVVLNYDNKIPLEQVKVYVYDRYTEYVYSYDGYGVQDYEVINSTGRNRVLLATVYAGETVEITTNEAGFTLDTVVIKQEELVADEDGKYFINPEEESIVYLNYSKETSKGIATDVTVYHYYSSYDLGERVAGYGYDENYLPDTVKVSSYVGEKYSATPNYKFNDAGQFGYDLVDADATSKFVDELTIELEDGTNEIHLYYEKDVENRTPVTVTIKHSYATYDTYLETYVNADEDALLAQSIIYTNGKNDSGKWVAYVGMTYKAQELLVDGYDRQTDDDDMKLVLTEVAEDNVIYVTYLKLVDSTPEEPDEPYVPSIPSIPSRPTTPTTPDDDDDDDDDTPVVEDEPADDDDIIVEIPEEEVPLEEAPEEEIPLVEIPEEEVPLVEIPDTEIPLVEIPEEEIPLVEIPEEEIPLVEIPEEEIPLNDIPQTGDNRNVTVLMTTTILSAAGLIALFKAEVDDKKKKTEN